MRETEPKSLTKPYRDLITKTSNLGGHRPSVPSTAFQRRAHETGGDFQLCKINTAELAKMQQEKRACDRHPLSGRAHVQTRERGPGLHRNIQEAEWKLKEQSFVIGKVFLRRHFPFVKDLDQSNENTFGKLNSYWILPQIHLKGLHLGILKEVPAVA